MFKVVRDGQIVWPYCEECGCRLNVYPWGSMKMLHHFVGEHTIEGTGNIETITLKTDARGHECSKLVYFEATEQSLYA